MHKREAEHLKIAAFDVVSGVQELRRERLALDAKIAALFRQGRSNGLDRAALKECLSELGDEAATVEHVWQLYGSKLGLIQADIADDDVLDKILRPQIGV